MTVKYTLYTQNIKNRTWLHFIIGFIPRMYKTLKFWLIRCYARKRGGKIGNGVIMPYKLAKKANKNLVIGDFTSIETYLIDTRSPVYIGFHVIIGRDSEIITTSHYIDDPLWKHKYYGIVIEDYVWIPVKCLILPSCRRICRGAIVQSGSVVVKDVKELNIVGGNPAQEIKKGCVYMMNWWLKACLVEI